LIKPDRPVATAVSEYPSIKETMAILRTGLAWLATLAELAAEAVSGDVWEAAIQLTVDVFIKSPPGRRVHACRFYFVWRAAP